MADSMERECCEYLNVRHAKLETKGDASSDHNSDMPAKIYKHWTNLWVVLKTDISPAQSFIAYCKKEEEWLLNQKSIAKCFLGVEFTVKPAPPDYSKKFSKRVLQLTFPSYRLDLAFDSMTKMDQWCKALQMLSDRHHVDLVRCPEQPHREREYVIQVCPSSFRAWSMDRGGAKLQWEWELRHIRRIHWHKNVNKLEVEPGRSSETGEGHFYFTGLHASRLFDSMKQMMSTHSMVTSPTTSPTALKRDTSSLDSSSSSSGGGRLRVAPPYDTNSGRRSGMDSEEDWTGTGDDWTGTGASSDSGFINFIRNRPENGYLLGLRGHPAPHSLCTSPPPPVPPKDSLIPSPQAGECHYMNLTSSTMDQDNQYVTINRQELIAMHNAEFKKGGPICDYQRPRPAGGSSTGVTTTSTLPGEHTSQSTDELVNSFTDEDGYCRMVPQRAIGRNGSLPNVRPPPIPPHKKQSVTAVPGVLVNAASINGTDL